jgi:hypothetical protein
LLNADCFSAAFVSFPPLPKGEVMNRRHAEPRQDHAGIRPHQLQGGKTHEQQLRTLERNPDGPDPEAPDRENEFAATVKAKPEAASPIKSKGSGSGAMTDLQDDLLGENDVLSNRDKAQSSGERVQDSRWNQTEQRADHVANRGRG